MLPGLDKIGWTACMIRIMPCYTVGNNRLSPTSLYARYMFPVSVSSSTFPFRQCSVFQTYCACYFSSRQTKATLPDCLGDFTGRREPWNLIMRDHQRSLASPTIQRNNVEDRLQI